jgi:hypothetical protein
MAQQVIGIGVTPNDGTGDSLRDAFVKVNANFSEVYQTVGGWAVYNDSQYTLSNPLVISQGVTLTMSNNANTVINTYLPVGVVNLWDVSNSKITPQNIGDYYITTFRFKAKNSAAFGLFETAIDLGGSTGILFKETQNMSNTALVEQTYAIVIPMYIAADFKLNGGIPKIKSISGTTSIYDIEFQFARIHKG